MKLYIGVREYDDKETKRKIDENKQLKIMEEGLQTGMHGNYDIIYFRNYFEIHMNKPCLQDIQVLKVI